MVRPLRIEYPGAFYHIINRGNAGESIYVDDRDRLKFLEYLEKAVGRFTIVIHAYCLLTTRYNLIVETPNSNISSAIQWLNVSYATYYNRKHYLWMRGSDDHGKRDEEQLSLGICDIPFS